MAGGPNRATRHTHAQLLTQRNEASMLKMVREHNTLNGFGFTIAEFVVLAALLMPFVLYYWLHQRWWEAVIATGIVLNCATVALTAARQRARGETQVGLRAMRRPELRAQIAGEHPGLAGHTMALTLSLLVPYLVTLWSLVDVARGV